MKWVASIAVMRDGKLLWMRRRDNGLWTLPGGHLEDNEEPLDGAARELTEETGLDPNGGQMEYLGNGYIPHVGINVHAFAIHLPEGEPVSDEDPDGEAHEFRWLDTPPDTHECHVPNEQNVTLRLMGLIPHPSADSDLVKSEGKKSKMEWRAKDGLRIPHHTSPERPAWDKAYHAKLVEFFGNGDPKRLRPVRVDVTPGMAGHFVQGAVGPGGRDRRSFYSRMVAGGDRLPPVIVRRSGLGWHVIDGNARMTAAEKHGLKQMDAFELVDPSTPPESKKTKVKKSDDDFYPEEEP